LSRDALFDHLSAALDAYYSDKRQTIAPEHFEGFQRWVTLQVIDKHWKDHLLAMDHLKEGIGLRGYGQKNPLNEYKREGFEMFIEMTERIKTEVVEYLFKAQFTHASDAELARQQRVRPQRAVAHRGNLPGHEADQGQVAVQTVRREGEKIGRNAPCPCGSGKKYKRCCAA
jgi:preprotein translocase subunit SecA